MLLCSVEWLCPQCPERLWELFLKDLNIMSCTFTAEEEYCVSEKKIGHNCIQHSSVILKMAEKLQELSLKGLNAVSCRTRCGAGAPSLAASVLMVVYCGELCYVLLLVL